MLYRKAYISVFVVVKLLILVGCTEPIAIEASMTFQSVLVVEATITNEEKRQSIVLSRTYALDQEGPSPETNAQVIVVDDRNNEFPFQETDPGKYVSTVAFGAHIGQKYRLAIKTVDGKSYNSDSQLLKEGAVIASVYPIRERNEFGDDGVAIYVDVTGAADGSRYFRFQYEETYKIVAPFYVAQDAAVINDQWPDFEYGLVERASRPVCYGERTSDRIILANSDGQIGNSIDRFQIKFAKSDDYCIAHRYSILVKQYSQSESAFAYYKTLRDFSQSENPFNENQPGFLEGNIVSVSEPNEKVIGFFNVSLVSEKRLFFNYTDFYPDAPLPPYPSFCSIVEPSAGCPGEGSAGCIPPLITNIQEEKLVFFALSMEGADPQYGGFQMVPFDCGDCTKLGSNTVPDFWEE
jgi:hypothetical protein